MFERLASVIINLGVIIMLTIDRFENGYAICERGIDDYIEIDKNDLPDDAREGDFVYVDTDGKYKLDKKQAAESGDKLSRRLSGLFADHK